MLYYKPDQTIRYMRSWIYSAQNGDDALQNYKLE